MDTLADNAKAAAAAAGAKPSANAAAWTPSRITAEVQSALLEVLGRALEPDEPFMSGEDKGRMRCIILHCCGLIVL